MRKVVAIIQARLGSSRLPAKVMLDLGGKTALERCVERVKLFAGVHEVWIATTTKKQDDLIFREAERLGVYCYRGSEQDVLSRYYETAVQAQADVIVRCTSDCPMLDPEISSRVILEFMESGADYASNVLNRRFPKGLDTEVFLFKALEQAHQNAVLPEEREHVTPYILRSDVGFKLRSVVLPGLTDRSEVRWTLDTLEDYVFLAGMFSQFEGEEIVCETI